MNTCKLCSKEMTKKSSKVYCSMPCQIEYKYQEKVRAWKENGVYSWSTIKRYLSQQKIGCWSCGIIEWMNKPIVLELEHIDGNSENNKEENLSLLCPNCHSQTPTYKSKNVGNGRHLRRLRYLEGKSF